MDEVAQNLDDQRPVQTLDASPTARPRFAFGADVGVLLVVERL
jgi:hypothetical protein